MARNKAQFKINGGVHPTYNKQLAVTKAIADMPLPPLLRVSMSQHLGAPAQPTVAKGDTVLRGQVIGDSSGFISAAVHAPTSGTVKSVAPAETASGAKAMAIEIEPDGEDTWVELTRHAYWEETAPKQLVEMVADAGICGMGGAGFPTHVKLSPPPEKPIDTLIINGAECEPYLTADHRLMLEYADQIAEGAMIVRRILGAEKLIVAIEDNKPDAIDAMEAALKDAEGDVSVLVLETGYPQGAEKQQIFAAIGKEVPSGGLPMDVGAVVENVGTTLAVWDAVVNGKPLTERVTTVTGYPVKNPGNVRSRIGTLYSDLIDFCDGTTGNVAKVISGGPMMGFAQHSLDVTTTKTTSGLLILAPDQVSEFTSMPCISCGRCVVACPMYLVPSEISQMIEAEDYETAEEIDVLDCIECGCCAFECPAHRPLVQHMKQGKSHIMLIRRQKKS